MTSNDEGNSKKYRNIAESIMLYSRKYHVSSLPEKIKVTTKGLVNKSMISQQNQQMFFKTDVLKSFANFTEKPLCSSL